MLQSRHKFPIEVINAVLDEDTCKFMEYRVLMKNPKYRNLYHQSYTKERGRLLQVMTGQVTGTNTMFFIDKQDFSSITGRTSPTVE